MPLLLHAITLKPEAVHLGVGLRGESLITVEDGPLTAWASALSEKLETFTRDDLLDHHRVVSEVFANVEACLPARFPTTLSDGEALAGQLQSRGAELSQQLERVRGCCELAITARWTVIEEAPTSVEAITPGRRYLLQRQQALEGSGRRHERARELAQELESVAGDDLVAAERRICPSAAIALSAALLVKRANAEDLKARLPRGDRDVRILVHGPWPPYSFAAVGPASIHG